MSTRNVLPLVLSAAILAAAGVAGAQTFENPQQILVPAAGGATGGFGFATDVDGTTAVITSPDETVGGTLLAGAAYVFVRDGSGAWVEQQRLTAGVANEHFGISAAINGDTLVVGAAPVLAAGTAPVRVYVRAGATWSLQAPLGAHRATALRVKGDVLVVGDADTNSGQGAVTIYERTGTSWGAPTTFGAPGGGISNAQFGAAVDLAGATLCVGVPRDTANAIATAGSVRIFTRTAAGVWPQQQKIDGPFTNTRFGSACAVDGDTVLIGASNIGNGSAYVYTRSASTWSQQQALTIGSISSNVAGKSVRLVGDVAVVGGTVNMSVFGRTGTSWTLRQTITRPGLPFSLLGLTATYLVVGTTPPGAGHGSAYVYTVAATGVPGPPTNFQATVSGSTVSMSWGAPATGAAPTAYTLVAKTAVGTTLLTAPLGLVNAFATPAPNGVFMLSVTASNAFGTGLESNAVTVTVPAGVAPPGPPANLAAAVTGSTAVFTWSAPASGTAPTNYLLVAGLSPGFTAPIASVPLPPAPLGFAAPGVPNGTYYVRLYAQNAGGTSASSNEVAFTVGTSAPTAPVLQSPSVVGHVVNLAWTAGLGGGAPAGYVITASLSPGGPVIATLPYAGTTIAIPGVPSGVFYVRVVAQNSGGVSAPSNEVAVVVP